MLDKAVETRAPISLEGDVSPSDKMKQSSSSELEMQTTSHEAALDLAELVEVGLFNGVVRLAGVVLFASSEGKVVLEEFSASDRIRQSSSSELAIQITSGVLSIVIRSPIDERRIFDVLLW